MLDYSAACNRHAVALEHVANLPGIIAMWSAQLKNPTDQRLVLQAMAGHADAALKDGYSPILKRHCGETAKLLADHLEDP